MKFKVGDRVECLMDQVVIVGIIIDIDLKEEWPYRILSLEAAWPGTYVASADEMWMTHDSNDILKGML